jgi:long-chain acyl-CoA synthetase
LVAELSGQQPQGDDALRLSEDFHLDSLGRVQLAAALDERLADAPKEGAVDAAKTLGDLRRIAAGVPVSRTAGHVPAERQTARGEKGPGTGRDSDIAWSQTGDSPQGSESEARPNPPTGLAVQEMSESQTDFNYPLWPWWRPVQWLRAAFLELVAQPLVWFLGAPKVSLSHAIEADEPMLIICNHVTAYDGALVEYAIPGRMRQRVAAAMLGEMLEDFRHFRDPDTHRFMLFGPAAYWLVTALYNVFPLPRRRGFQRSFAHAGKAMDRGYNVLVFPEGTRSAAGQLAPFRPGIGLLVKQTHAPVLPVSIVGLGELKATSQSWFRSGKIEIRVGNVMRFEPTESEAAITETLHARVVDLMKTSNPKSS